jgi:sugar phosphate isomerase/epimerase
LAENVFWVPKKARWSHLQANAKQPTIGKLIDEAMTDIEKVNPGLNTLTSQAALVYGPERVDAVGAKRDRDIFQLRGTQRPLARLICEGGAMLARRTFLASSLSVLVAPASADPLGLRPGIQLYTVGDTLRADAPGTLKALAAIGFRTVETAGLGKYSPKDFRKLLDDAGLVCASCHLDFKDGDNGSQFEIARILGARFVVSAGLFGAVGANPGNADADAFHRMAALAGHIGTAARRMGLSFALHNHNMEFRPIEGTTGFDLLLKQTDPAAVGFEMDCGWVRVSGHDPVRYLKDNPGRFPLLHIKDFHTAPAPRTAPGGPPGAILGRGFIDYRPIFAAAKGVKRYFVEQEPPYRDFTALDAVRADYAYLHAL